jgi:MFS family permease
MLALSFFFATYVPFLVERGMNLLQINVINAFFMAFIIIAEMPTGSFADNFGRHRSVSAGCFLLGLSFLVYYSSESFPLFILAEIIGAIGQTFTSGAMEAWLVDSLKARGESHLKDSVFRQELVFKSIGTIIGCILGSIIGGINLSFPWLASASFMFICALVSFFIKENYQPEKRIRSKNGLIKQMREAWIYGIKNKELLLIMVFGTTISFSVQAINMQWTLIFKEGYGFSSPQLGMLFVGISLSTAAGSRFSKKITRLFNEKSAIIIPQIITALAIILCSRASGFTVVISAFLIHEFGRGIFNPLKQSYVNNRLRSESRATLLSLESMFAKLGALGGLLVSGLVAEMMSIKSAWLFSGVFLLLGVWLFMLIGLKTAISKS